MKQDILYLRGMVFHAQHGVFDWEREVGCVFRVDLELTIDLRPAGETDNLALTVDYGALYRSVQNVLGGKPVALLETLAEGIAKNILANFPPVRLAGVRVEKEGPPVGGLAERSGVAIFRDRGEGGNEMEAVSLPVVAYVALGSNVGDRGEAIRGGLAAIDRLPLVKVEEVSGIYETQAVGPIAQNDFFNAVARLRVGYLQPHLLLGSLLGIETAMGRKRQEPGGPRPIDLDLLFFGSLEIADDILTLPHPRLTERAFVLKPLLELAPSLVMPTGERVSGFLPVGEEGGWVRCLGKVEDVGK